MTAVDVEPDTIAHLDFAPRCESTACEPDPPPATHVRHSTFCPCRPVVLLCDHCTQQLLAIIRQVPHPTPMHCIQCSTWRIVRLADVFTIRPLTERTT